MKTVAHNEVIFELTRQSNVLFASFRINFCHQSEVKGLIMPLSSEKPSYVQKFKSNRLNKGNWRPHTLETDTPTYDPKAFGAETVIH